MNRRFIPLLGCCLTLTGCTDIRSRLSPDVLAIETGSTVRTAMHATQDDSVLTAEADSPMLFREALERKAGASVSAGHLSLLLISGNPADILPDYLYKQFISPTCKVLYVPENACGLLQSGDAPTAGQLDAAVSTGQLPARTADLVFGDLCGGSGVSVLPAYSGGRLTLAAFSPEEICGFLSESACRGLALLAERYETFAFDAEGAPCTIRSRSLHISAEKKGESLCFAVSGSVRAETAHPEAAHQKLTEMLLAALTETARNTGADILFLRETAVRNKLAGIAGCSREQWRSMLQTADFCVNIQLTA